MFFPGCLQAPSQFVSIGKFTLASAVRPAAAVIDPLLLCESLPALQTTILEATRVSWAKSALVSYVDVLRRNAGVRDAESALEKVLEQIRSASNGDLRWPLLKLRSWLYRPSTFQQIPSSPFTSPNCSPRWRTKLARERRDQVPAHWH
jgi:hypothetical protein